MVNSLQFTRKNRLGLTHRMHADSPSVPEVCAVYFTHQEQHHQHHKRY